MAGGQPGLPSKTVSKKKKNSMPFPVPPREFSTHSAMGAASRAVRRNGADMRDPHRKFQHMEGWGTRTQQR
jgi:hypothetical protein